MMTSPRTIVLVACGKAKRRSACAARDLYTSTLFRKSREVAEVQGERWYILSAKYGLLDPRRLIEPYDASLKDLSVIGRDMWARGVVRDLQAVTRAGDRIVLFGGRYYREPLAALLVGSGFEVTAPLEGLSIGRQLQRLNQMTARVSWLFADTTDDTL
jgi:hypothetical protein